MSILYDLLFLIYALAVLPFLLVQGKWHDGFKMRFGSVPEGVRSRLAGKRNIWVHAVSVGEVAAVEGILRRLRELFPGYQIVLSVTTRTGYSLAQQKYMDGAVVIWSPLDLSFAVRSFCEAIKPRIYIAAETELWPNLFGHLSQAGVPILVVNGRISDKAFPRYQAIRWVMKPLLSKVSMFCMQSELDAQRIRELGASEAKVRNVGNVKFDNIPEIDLPDPRGFGFEKDDLVWVAGSTHPGEEDLIIEIYEEMRSSFPGLRLVIAPRHPERGKEVADLVRRAGLTPIFFSTFQKTRLKPQDILIVDTIGQLLRFYALATVVFVGKSLAVKGGHNIIEPAALGKSVLIGPHMQNFKDITRVFTAGQGIVQVPDPAGLKSALRKLLASADARAALGKRARDIVLENCGATERTVGVIQGFVS